MKVLVLLSDDNLSILQCVSISLGNGLWEWRMLGLCSFGHCYSLKGSAILILTLTLRRYCLQKIFVFNICKFEICFHFTKC